eukprot:1200733-Ditylum_brightwellii.AAC.1
MSQKRKPSDLHAGDVDMLTKKMVGWKGEDMPGFSFCPLISVSTSTPAFVHHSILILEGYKQSKSDGVPCIVT